jgi:hypothetical protein
MMNAERLAMSGETAMGGFGVLRSAFLICFHWHATCKALQDCEIICEYRVITIYAAGFRIELEN